MAIDPFLIETPLVGKFGGLSFPLNPDMIDGSFVALDPARSRMAALFAAAIQFELEPIWNKFTRTSTPLTGKKPVETIFELDPSVHLARQVQLTAPILALHRLGDQEWSEFTIQVDKCEQDWNLHYILPELSVSDTRRAFDVLRVIPEIARRVIKKRGHPAFENGELQFFGDKGGLGSIKMTKAAWGQARFGGEVESPVWLATTITLHTIEYGSDTEEEYGPLDSIDWNIGIGDSTGVIHNMIEAYSEVLPSD